MRVLVAGAGGAVGSEAVRELVARGHEVTGMTRTGERHGRLRELGAVPVAADALDLEAVRRAVARARPEGVASLLTSLPRGGPRRLRDLEPTNRLRDAGTRNLVAAAAEAGARRFVGESIIAIYGYPEAPRDGGVPAPGEDTPPGREAKPGLRRAIEAIVAGERHVAEASRAGRIEGCSLRFGFYHGPTVPSSREILAMVRRRRLPVIGDGRGVHSWVDTRDAGRAVADALERAPAGSVFNVVDDEPVRFRDYVRELARLADAPRPRRVPYWLARAAMPYAAMFLARSRVTASNARAKEELGWRPAHPTYREALADLVRSAG